MGDVKDEIQAAMQHLELDKSKIQLLDDDNGERVFKECINHFLNSGDRRWWWEDFKFPSFSVTGVDSPFTLIEKIIPLKEGNVWLIVEDDEERFYPVYDCDPTIIPEIISECFAFEYYIIDKNKEWLLCENHHNRLIAIGDKLLSSNFDWQPD